MVTVPVDTKELCTVHATVNCTAGHVGIGSTARLCAKVSTCIKKDNKELNSRQRAGSYTRKKITPKFTEPVVLLVSQEIMRF